MNIKWMYKEIKYNLRKFIIRLVKPTRFEWAVWSPFGDFDGIESVYDMDLIKVKI